MINSGNFYKEGHKLITFASKFYTLETWNIDLTCPFMFFQTILSLIAAKKKKRKMTKYNTIETNNFI